MIKNEFSPEQHRQAAYNATMAVRLRVWLVAALLLCIFIFSSSAAEAAADDNNNNSVCTANDTREECSAQPENNDSSSDDDEEDDEIPASCVDENENCRTWSDEGECDANPDCELFIRFTHHCYPDESHLLIYIFFYDTHYYDRYAYSLQSKLQSMWYNR